MSGFGSVILKVVWELFHFDPVDACATQAAPVNSEKLTPLNIWLADWTEEIPRYAGPNCKYGQAASIRVMHLSLAALLLEQATTAELGLRSLMKILLRRSASTTSYALGQQNNHVCSEVAALSVSGTTQGEYNSEAEKWMQQECRFLENSACVLIVKDSIFREHSFVYHRLMREAWSFAEVCRREINLPKFSDRLYEQLRSATWWVELMGDAQIVATPNMSADDGAKVLTLNDEGYRRRPHLYRNSQDIARRRA